VLPNLIIIGGQKCGTTSLHNYLAAHPQVAMSERKELDFFTSWGRRRGLGWYEAQFPQPAQVRGESSPAYAAWPHILGVPEAIHETVPQAKLIYLVRDPVERIVSEYLHNVGHGVERRPFAEVVAEPGFAASPYVAKSRYAMQLERYLELFERSQLLVLTQEELSVDRMNTLRRVFRFLGVDESFVSPRFLRRYNRARDRTRADTVARRARGLVGEERFDRLSAHVPRAANRAVDRVFWRPISRPEVGPAMRAALVELVAEDSTSLAELTGLDLSHWRLPAALAQ
jgi:hypothetical protein